MAVNSIENIMKNFHNQDYEKNNDWIKKIFGFWVYLMSDCILFCVLFATYAVLLNNNTEEFNNKDILKLPLVLIETFVLLMSSISSGAAIIASYKNKVSQVIYWLLLTWLLGVIFIIIESYELNSLIIKGFKPNNNGFLSSFFTLIGTHGLHILCGLIWISVIIIHLLINGLTEINKVRIMCLSMFWHFLDIIWICIFSIVYLMGTLK